MSEKPDLSKQPTLYVVGYAHLDTEWRWEWIFISNLQECEGKRKWAMEGSGMEVSEFRSRNKDTASRRERCL